MSQAKYSLRHPKKGVSRREKKDPVIDLFKRYDELKRTNRDHISLRNFLVRKFLPLVEGVACRLAAGFPKSVELKDLINSGVTGLIEALDSFDYSRGITFETFAVPRIRGAILDNLRVLDWMPRLARSRNRKIDKATTKLENRLGRPPLLGELARELSITTDDLLPMIFDHSVTVLSLDEMITRKDDNKQVPRIETIPSQTQNALERLEKQQLKKAVTDNINNSTLTEQERLVLLLYYPEELTLKEIGDIILLSESRVSQIRTGAISKLREKLKRDDLIVPQCRRLEEEIAGHVPHANPDIFDRRKIRAISSYHGSRKETTSDKFTVETKMEEEFTMRQESQEDQEKGFFKIVSMMLKDPSIKPTDRADMWEYEIRVLEANPETFQLFADIRTYEEITDDILTEYINAFVQFDAGLNEIIEKAEEFTGFLKRVGIDFNIPILGIDPLTLEKPSGEIPAPKKPKKPHERKPKRKPGKKDKKKTRLGRKSRRKPKKKDERRTIRGKAKAGSIEKTLMNMKFSKGKRGEADQKLREKKKVGLAIYAYKLSTVRGMNHRLISEDITDITGVDFGIKGVENLFSQKINPAIRTFPPKAAGKGANPPKDFEKAREEVNAVLIKGGYGSLEHIVKDQRKRRKMSFKEISEWLKRTAKGFVISEENLENLYNNLSG